MSGCLSREDQREGREEDIMIDVGGKVADEKITCARTAQEKLSNGEHGSTSPWGNYSVGAVFFIGALKMSLTWNSTRSSTAEK